MEEIRLDGVEMTDKKKTHSYIKEKLALPDYYGNNLDALWDCLSTDYSQKIIVIVHPGKLVENLGQYGGQLIAVFQEAATVNPFLHVKVVFDDADSPGDSL